MARRSKNAEEVAVALFQIFLNMGFPSVISGDQDREFVNMLMEKLSEKLKFVQRISSLPTIHKLTVWWSDSIRP